MPSKGTPTRNIRVPDWLWQAALDKADRDGTTVSEAVVAFLRRWVR